MKRLIFSAAAILPCALLLGAGCWTDTITCSADSRGCAFNGSITVCQAGCNPAPAGQNGWTVVTRGSPVEAVCTTYSSTGGPDVFMRKNCALGNPGSPWVFVGNCGTGSGSTCCWFNPNAGGAVFTTPFLAGYKVSPCQKEEGAAPCAGT